MTTGQSQNAFSKLAGVSQQAVNAAVKTGRLPQTDGRIVVPDGMTPAEYWDATGSSSPQAMALSEKFKEEKARAKFGDDMPPIERLGAALKVETLKLQKAKAEMANLELDKMAGTLIDRSDVEHALADIGEMIRSAVENLSTRLYSVHQGDAEKIATIESVAASILVEIGEMLKRKAL